MSNFITKRLHSSPFWNKLFKNASIAFFGTTAASVIELISLAVTVQFLEVSAYGLLVLAQQYMILIDGIANFQSWQAVIKFGTDAKVHNDENRLLANMKTGFLVDGVTAVLGMAVALLLLPIVASFLSWSEMLISAAFLFSLEIVFHIEGSSIGILRLFDKFDWVAIHGVVNAALKLLCLSIYIFGPFSCTFFGIVAIYVATDIIKHISLLVVALVFISRKYSIRRLFKTSLQFSDKKMVNFTIWSNLGTTVDIPVKYLDVFIISAVSVEMVAIYKVYKQLLQAFSLLTSPISAAIMPQISELVSRDKSRDAYKAVLKIRNYIAALLVVVFVLCIFAAPTLLELFFGKEYAVNIVLFLALFIIQAYGISYVALHPYFYAIGKVKADTFITLIANLMYLVIAFALVGYIDVYAVLLAMAVQFAISIQSKKIIVSKWLNTTEKGYIT